VLIGKGVRSHLTDSITLADVERPLDFAVANGLIKNKFNVRDLLASSVVLTGKAE
jgi:hypothetical protein